MREEDALDSSLALGWLSLSGLELLGSDEDVDLSGDEMAGR